jgi:hypothetical protein
VYGFQANDSTSRQGQASKQNNPDLQESLLTILGLVLTNNTNLTPGALQQANNFYYQNALNLKRRYAAVSIATASGDVVGMGSYLGVNPCLVQIYADGSAVAIRNNGGVTTTFAAGSIVFSSVYPQVCSFDVYGQTLYVATGAGLWAFSMVNPTVTLTDVTYYYAEYGLDLDSGTNLEQVAVGDALIINNATVFVRGTKIRATGDRATFWVYGDGLQLISDNQTITVVGKPTITGQTNGVNWSSRTNIREESSQTYGHAAWVARHNERLYLLTTTNFLAGSFPGLPQNFTVVSGGAFFNLVTSNNRFVPSGLLEFQQRLIVSLVDRTDNRYGQISLWDEVNSVLSTIFPDVGAIANTLFSFLDTAFFLNGRGVHEITTSNVRDQLGTPPVTNAIRKLFDEQTILNTKPSLGIYDQKAGQLLFAFETSQQRFVLTIDPLNIVDASTRARRCSFYTGLTVTHGCQGKDAPYLSILT